MLRGEGEGSRLTGIVAEEQTSKSGKGGEQDRGHDGTSCDSSSSTRWSSGHIGLSLDWVRGKWVGWLE
jgi:hypothetical protein